MGSPLDPATVTGYALLYMAAIAVIVLLLLPILITFFLLLLAAGALQALVFLVKVAASALIRGVVGLFRNPGDPRGPGGHHGGLVPH